MDDGIITSIEMELTNRSNDTLSLDLGTVKLSSRNVSYQYNDKPLPLPPLRIPPIESDIVRFTGSETTGKEDWLKIAGEQLTLTIEGIRLGLKVLPRQVVTFVPENPKM